MEYMVIPPRRYTQRHLFKFGLFVLAFLNIMSIIHYHLNNSVTYSYNNAHSQIDTSATLTAKVADPLARDLMVMRRMGSPWTTIENLRDLIRTDESVLLRRMTEMNREIQRKGRPSHGRPQQFRHSNPQPIYLAGVVCGGRREEFMTMATTAVIFSQDAALHFIVFSDSETIIDIAQDILELKWTCNALGWDFTYELHQTWFPSGDGVNWGQMYSKCATQRLFFPQLLPHIDSVIYLDSDILVLSNLTEMWLTFPRKMGDQKMAASALNNEPTAVGFYSKGEGGAKIPYYGDSGLNAGVLLMNLTQMRAFKFTERSIAAHTLYKGKIKLADQDIINIIFHGFPERLHQLDCTYNFMWIHCRNNGPFCEGGNAYCFCNATFSNGIHILHGNLATFFLGDNFLTDAYKGFKQVDLLTESIAELVTDLKAKFIPRRPRCGSLTAEMLYRNAEKYLQMTDSWS